MSMTVTQTATATVEVIHATLRLRSLDEHLRKSLSAIMATVRDSQIFSEAAKKEFSSWNDSFEKEYLASLNTAVKRENAAYSVCYLILDILRPVILAQDNNNVQNLGVLFAIEDDLRDIIKQLLGENYDVDSLLNKFENSGKEEANLMQQLAKIEAAFQQGMKEICKAANKSNAEFTTQFEALQKRLQLLVQHQATNTNALHQRIDALNIKFQQVCLSQKNTAQKTSDTGLQLKAQLAKTAEVLQSAANLVQNKK